MTDPVHVVVYGASGRMGQAILRAAPACSAVHVSAALVRPGSGLDERPLRQVLGPEAPDLDFHSALDPDTPVDALVDFSGPHAFDSALALAVERRVAFVSGTTGLSDEQYDTLGRAAEVIPVLWASNFSLGVALLTRFARMAAAALVDWDCEIIEFHHRRKTDAPSGTALTLGYAAAEGRGVDLRESAVHGRKGQVGARPMGDIGFHAVRGGDVVGEHTIIFAGDGERLELSHRAGNRDVFAIGALLAAARLTQRSPGRYAMDDMLAG